MENKLLLLFNLLLFAAVIQAVPVSKTEAQKKAQQFISGKIAAARGTSTPDLQLATADGDNYYVFNVTGQQGFVIVSGDDRAPEILGYSDEGQFDAANIPSNMKAWLQGYADEIQNMPENVASSRGTGQKRVVKTSINPLLQTLWDQDDPYNLKAPNFVNGARSVTGCVATAMAQILYYTAMHFGGFPSATTQIIPSYQFATKWSAGPLTKPAVGITTFDWENMFPIYYGSETSTQKNAVAALMECCGASVEMDYADQVNGGSEASVARVAHALKTYFGFGNSIQYKNRSLYTTAEWEDLLYTELRDGRPVLYGGQSSGGGHAFVCDGYDGDGYYHINWGWSGSNNGFFLLSALNPYGSGIGGSNSSDGYSMSQDAVIGFQAPSGNDEPEEVRMTVNSFKFNNSNMTYPKSSASFYYLFTCTNNLSDTYDVTVACDIFNSNNEYVRTLQDWHITDNINNIYWDKWQNGVSMSNNGYRTNINLSSLSNGTYKLKLRSKLTSDNTYYECFNADKYYIQAVVNGSQITFSNVAPSVNLSTAASDITLTSDGIVNTMQTVSAKITNNGDAYHGSVYLFVDGTKVSGNGLSVEADGTTTAYFSFNPTTAGEKQVRICTDENGTNEIGSGTITIVVNSNIDGLILPEIYCGVDLSYMTNVDIDSYKKTDDNNVTVDLYSQSTSIKVKYVNGSNSGISGIFVAFARYNENSGTYANYTWATRAYNMSANSFTGWITIDGIANDYGKYEVRLYKNGSMDEANLLDNHFHFELVKGYVAQTADSKKQMVKVTEGTPKIAEDVLAVELDANNFADVTPNTNPNTLYIITGGDTPESLSGKNIIDGTSNTAETITLTDGNSFASPITFTADEISYTRRITTGTDGQGNGWTTIVLPFDVDEVLAGDEKIDWFHNASDTKGRFWVRKFVDDGTNSVTFDFTDRIEANTPYIIAVPGDTWPDYDLTDKTLTFKASDASVYGGAKAVTTGNCYKFSGTTLQQSLNNVYMLNEEGSKFKKSTDTIDPFRAYFQSLSQNSATSLNITSNGKTTAIGQLPAEIATPDGIYTLDGRKVKGNLKKGVYIVNGKKMIK